MSASIAGPDSFAVRRSGAVHAPFSVASSCAAPVSTPMIGSRPSSVTMLRPCGDDNFVVSAMSLLRSASRSRVRNAVSGGVAVMVAVPASCAPSSVSVVVRRARSGCGVVFGGQCELEFRRRRLMPAGAARRAATSGANGAIRPPICAMDADAAARFNCPRRVRTVERAATIKHHAGWLRRRAADRVRWPACRSEDRFRTGASPARRDRTADIEG